MTAVTSLHRPSTGSQAIPAPSHEAPPRPVLLLGTLDTKGAEIAFVRDLLRAASVSVFFLDAGVQRPPLFEPDIIRQQVYAAADGGKAIEAVARGAATTIGAMRARNDPPARPKGKARPRE